MTVERLLLGIIPLTLTIIGWFLVRAINGMDAAIASLTNSVGGLTKQLHATDINQERMRADIDVLKRAKPRRRRKSK